jgi:ParB/Sulfiredoxin domain
MAGRDGGLSAVGRVASMEAVPVKIKNLLLDSENARLSSVQDGETQQDDLARILWNEMAVDEVALSIAANGFFPEEPLIVIPKDPNEKDEGKRKYIVVEGNRRLAAIRILREPTLRAKLKATDLPTVDEESRSRLDEIPVFIYPDRESVWAYCGFRHINGTKPWDSFSKAKYVTSVHENFGVPLEEIAKRIGDRHATVKRLFRGYVILQQAEKQRLFAMEDRVRNRFYFSHLYTAVDQAEFQEFLGITSDGSLEPNPVPRSKRTELKEFFTWLYGRKSDQVEPLVRTQNPDLGRLREVVSKPASLAALRSGYSLDRAYEISVGDKRRFRNALTSAKEELQQAKATVTTGYTGEEDLFETIKEIMEYARTIIDEMSTKRRKRQERN